MLSEKNNSPAPHTNKQLQINNNSVVIFSGTSSSDLGDQCKGTGDSTGNHDGSTAVVELAPPQLQLSELGLGGLLPAVLVAAVGDAGLEDVGQLGHSLVHGHLDEQGPGGGGNVEGDGGGELWEFRLGDEVAVAGAQVGGAGEDDVGQGAQGVEGREKVLAVVEEVGGLLGRVVDGHADDVVRHGGHDQRGLQDRAAKVDGGTQSCKDLERLEEPRVAGEAGCKGGHGCCLRYGFSFQKRYCFRFEGLRDVFGSLAGKETGDQVILSLPLSIYFSSDFDMGPMSAGTNIHSRSM